MLSEISQTKKDKYKYCKVCGILKKSNLYSIVIIDNNTVVLQM